MPSLRSSVVICATLTWLGSMPLAWAAGEHQYAAVALCRNHPNDIYVSDDRSVLCFDGELRRDQTLDIFDRLKDGGQFVIRSRGGWPNTSIAISEILMNKGAEVVVYDYCLSGCANYIFFASRKTYVMKDAIVAWHGNSIRRGQCESETLGLFKERSLSQEDKEYVCQQTPVLARFLNRRKMNADYLRRPLSVHTLKTVQLYYREHGSLGRVFWMWNPRHYAGASSTHVIYESYPQTQEEVDNLRRKLRLGIRIIYDP